MPNSSVNSPYRIKLGPQRESSCKVIQPGWGCHLIPVQSVYKSAKNWNLRFRESIKGKHCPVIKTSEGSAECSRAAWDWVSSDWDMINRHSANSGLIIDVGKEMRLTWWGFVPIEDVVMLWLITWCEVILFSSTYYPHQVCAWRVRNPRKMWDQIRPAVRPCPPSPRLPCL